METKTIYVVGGREFVRQNYYDTRERAYCDDDRQFETGDEVIEFAEVARFKLEDKGSVEGLEPVDTEFIDALQAVVDYLYVDEQNNFEELDRPKQHIFRSVIALADFLENIKK